MRLLGDGLADLACAGRAHYQDAEFAHVDGGVLMVRGRVAANLLVAAFHKKKSRDEAPD